MKIAFVTGNREKFEEDKAILSENGIECEHINLDCPEIQADPQEIAKHKAKYAAEKIGKACFVDDTALCFNALNGLPGEYIKFFADKLGLKKLVKLLDGFEDKTAKAMAVVAYCKPGIEPVVFEGVVNGKIVEARGNRFVWDPIFQPDGHSQTYAEMPQEEKNKISHRKKAMEKFVKYLKEE
ncbi:RdgB/HAM1 family non-canonical purine NTP pyrophosphatase [Candidatus Woesearchaeota archaeon]|nr:RdgB/HAM1 family non-canonical purine NTP pyrophosphatase [Candidatus Woesearchaeota archaeon]